MNQSTIERLKLAAPSIEKFRQLHPDEQIWIEPLMNQTTKTALDILDAIANTPLTYEEIANTCELHINSVKQINLNSPSGRRGEDRHEREKCGRAHRSPSAVGEKIRARALRGGEAPIAKFSTLH